MFPTLLQWLINDVFVKKWMISTIESDEVVLFYLFRKTFCVTNLEFQLKTRKDVPFKIIFVASYNRNLLEYFVFFVEFWASIRTTRWSQHHVIVKYILKLKISRFSYISRLRRILCLFTYKKQCCTIVLFIHSYSQINNNCQSLFFN